MWYANKIRGILFLGALIPFLTFTTINRAAIQGCIQPPSGLVSWWPGDGHANDIQGSNHGILQNGATFAPGMVGQAFSFDGIDDHVSVSDDASLRLSQLTLSAWINPTDVASNGGIITKAQASGNWVSYMIRLLDNGRVNFVTENQAENRSAHWLTFSALSNNTWFHVAATWQNFNGDSTDAKIYINGVEQPIEMSANFGYGPTFTPGYTSEPLFIGKQEVPADGFFRGLIDEADVYGRVLSPSEIQAIFDVGSAGKCKDGDGDGVPDIDDQCQNSNISPTVVIAGCDSGVPNTVFPNGCTISDRIAQCADGAQNHGQFVSCVAQLTNELKRAGVITGPQKGAIQSCAAQANIP